MPREIPGAETGSGPGGAISRRLHERLGGDGHEREAAVLELHTLLLKAARFELNRRRDSLPHLGGDDCEDLAQQSADDALLAVLRKLGEFRGESRFTTWAYKFALLEAGVKVRRRAWQGREVPLEDEAWATLADAGAAVPRQAEDRELIGALRAEIERSLTTRQREVLVAVALNDVPIDVLAERLGSNRGALYKTLHDARKKLRRSLAERGLEPSGNRLEER
ncbi:MAG TPA: sigma-70 family RNA polymerase sigma factor [Solirubrobacterales bacterium]